MIAFLRSDLHGGGSASPTAAPGRSSDSLPDLASLPSPAGPAAVAVGRHAVVSWVDSPTSDASASSLPLCALDASAHHHHAGSWALPSPSPTGPAGSPVWAVPPQDAGAGASVGGGSGSSFPRGGAPDDAVHLMRSRGAHSAARLAAGKPAPGAAVPESGAAGGGADAVGTSTGTGSPSPPRQHPADQQPAGVGAARPAKLSSILQGVKPAAPSGTWRRAATDTGFPHLARAAV